MKITVIVDNNQNPLRPELRAEHGLALLIDVGEVRILFDTGASDVLSKNAKLLGLDLTTVSAVVLSHGHFDHGGGLAAFAAINGEARIYVGQGALDKHYIKAIGPMKKSIGVDKALTVAIAGRIIVVNSHIEIAEGVFLLSQIRPAGRMPSDRRLFYKDTVEGIQQDDFAHEMMLVIEEKNELVLFTGCSHNGIMNMIEVAQKTFPGKLIKAVIGGFHLTNPITKKLVETQDYIKLIGRALAENKSIQKVISGHCTGKPAFGLLKEEMKEKLNQIEVGMQMEL